MDITVYQNKIELGQAAGATAAALIRRAIAEKESANIILATGTSQFDTLKHLTEERHIDWSKVVMFHLDEYIGLSVNHPASFRKYLIERFISRVPPLRATYLINGEADATAECGRLNDVISKHAIDVALVGVGENGHLAFNDPPADFDTEDPYIIVELDERCRQQQVNEGWFKSIEDVPRRAISMSVRQILKAECIICSVPEGRKALAVRNSLQHGVSNLHPASILQLHSNCKWFLDKSSASLLSKTLLNG